MRFVIVLLGGMLAWGQPGSQPPAAPPTPAADAVVLTVGDQKITRAQFELILSTLTEQQRSQAQIQTPAGRRRIAESLAELGAMAQEARARKLDQSPAVKTEIQLRSDEILAQNLYKQFLETAKADEATVRAYYEAHKGEWEELHARHILIRFQGSRVPLKDKQKDLTESEALAKIEDIHKRILAGGDFKKFAETESDDAGNAPQGGDLGSFGKGRMVPEFDKVAWTLETGKVSEPVKTAFGYHLILVEGHTSKKFEDVRTEIEQKIKPEQAQKNVADIKKKTPAVFDETYFGK